MPTYVRPPLLGREAPPAWRAVWRLRLVVLLLLVLLVGLFFLAYRELSGANEQDLGLQFPGRPVTPGSPLLPGGG